MLGNSHQSIQAILAERPSLRKNTRFVIVWSLMADFTACQAQSSQIQGVEESCDQIQEFWRESVQRHRVMNGRRTILWQLQLFTVDSPAWEW